MHRVRDACKLPTGKMYARVTQLQVGCMHACFTGELCAYITCHDQCYLIHRVRETVYLLVMFFFVSVVFGFGLEFRRVLGSG